VPAPRDASTIILIRRSAHDLEVFLVRRHEKSGFMAGAHVFPGGKVDDRDRQCSYLAPEVIAACAATLEPTPGASLSAIDAAAFFIAAVRELFEEAGVLIADHVPDDAGRWRARLQANEVGFAQLVRETRVVPRVERLAYFAHWLTPSIEQRRYDTRFFVAELPPGQEASADATETTEGLWIRPAEALARFASGAMFLPPPTRRILEEIGSGPIDLADRAINVVLPKVSAAEGSITIVLPWDPEYGSMEGEGIEVPRP
jgi:8-oxo-dGTP pyrophosphatase MutT (NUDIX family)